jgi:integrase
MATGIVKRHGRRCTSRDGRKCNCDPSFEAWVYDQHSQSKVRKTFPSHAAAEGWRTDAKKDKRDGKLARTSTQTVRELGEEWLGKCERGEVLSRRRVAYKPSALRTYRHDLATYVYPDFGAVKLSELRRRDLQALVHRLTGEGYSGSKVRNVIVPVQSLYRYAKGLDLVNADPTDDLELPEPGGSREWEGTPEDAGELLEALPEADRALWAVAFYAGLRRGELRALRVEDLHGLEGRDGWLSVEHSWDDVEGEIAPKSKAGTRLVPLPETLRVLLAAHVKRTCRSGSELVFGRSGSAPFTPTHVRKQARDAWEDANAERAEQELEQLAPVGLHECRHGYRSFLDASGIPEASIDRYMGHSSGQVGRRYSHALRGQLGEHGRHLDDYLNRGLAEVVQLPTGAQAGAQSLPAARLSQGA